MPDLLKKAALIGLGALLVWLAVSFFRGDERHLWKTSEKLIQLASDPRSLPNMAILKKTERITKHIHFDIRFRAEFQGRVQEGKSLNEARSFLMAYFKSKINKGFAAEDLSVRLLPSAKNRPGKRAETSFSFRFQREGRRFKCRALWGWIKEKKWYIKTAEVSSCSQAH